MGAGVEMISSGATTVIVFSTWPILNQLVRDSWCFVRGRESGAWFETSRSKQYEVGEVQSCWEERITGQRLLPASWHVRKIRSAGKVSL